MIQWTGVHSLQGYSITNIAWSLEQQREWPLITGVTLEHRNTRLIPKRKLNLKVKTKIKVTK